MFIISKLIFFYPFSYSIYSKQTLGPGHHSKCNYGFPTYVEGLVGGIGKIFVDGIIESSMKNCIFLSCLDTVRIRGMQL